MELQVLQHQIRCQPDGRPGHLLRKCDLSFSRALTVAATERLCDLVRQEWLGPRVVDSVLEDVRLHMETNDVKYNQRRIAVVKFLSELYNYRLVDSSVIFKVKRDSLFIHLFISSFIYLFIYMQSEYSNLSY